MLLTDPPIIPQKSELNTDDGTNEIRSIVGCLPACSGCIVLLVIGALPLRVNLHQAALKTTIPQNSKRGYLARKLTEGENEFLSDGISSQGRHKFGVHVL